MDYIYILELSNGNYYIGKTKNVAKRFIEHKEEMDLLGLSYMVDVN
jgi:predicted GIY-YIG superfamily endonuclease